MDDNQNNNAFSMIADIDGDFFEMSNDEMPTNLPLLVTRNMVMFPAIVAPIIIARTSSNKLIRKCEKNHDLIAVIPQLDPNVESPSRPEEVFSHGVYARVVKSLELPGGGMTTILQAFGRLSLVDVVKTKPYLVASVKPAPEELQNMGDPEFKTAIEDLRKRTLQYIRINEDIPDEAMFAISNVKNDVMMINYLCTNLPFDFKEKMKLLEISDIKERLFGLMRLIDRDMKLQQLKQNIREKTRDDLDEQQRNYFIQQQIKNLQAEINNGECSPERNELMEKANGKKMSEEVFNIFVKELDKLDQLHPQSPEFNVQLSYLQTFVSLPWGEYTDDDHNLRRAQRVLDRDHYGMDKVKERILEYIAVLSLRSDLKSPIICLYGPPGVGKTSLGKSIANSLRRKYVRVSLGGVHDEAEIRGHRRTYVGAMPGRIVAGLRTAVVRNPLMLLDEIDKMSSDYKGDTASAMLEVLDSEQNHKFRDHYVELPIDLSEVLFVASANSLQDIPGPLMDRMEIIEVSSYTENEKFHIAKDHLMAKQFAKNGIEKGQLKITDKALKDMISFYTREAGVRGLERRIGEICRKSARKLYEKETDKVRVSAGNLEEYLGKPKYRPDKKNKKDEVGIVRGLAWTSVGGVTLEIEVNVMPGKGNLVLTGKLGDVMKESAQTGISYIRSISGQYDVKPEFFQENDIHIHIPEGAVPKDGPSAGITMALAMLSAITNHPVRADIAMTGEITLRGRVLPIGGLKEKLLAAKNAGMHTVCVPKENEKDLREISEEITEGMEILLVEHMDQVIKAAFV